eukprot:2647333-Amphidinium_carterae.1
MEKMIADHSALRAKVICLVLSSTLSGRHQMLCARSGQGRASAQVTGGAIRQRKAIRSRDRRLSHSMCCCITLPTPSTFSSLLRRNTRKG